MKSSTIDGGDQVSEEPEALTPHPALRWLQGTLLVGGILLSFISALGFLGRFHWVLDLFSHFRVQYTVTLAVLSGLALVVHYRRTALGLLLMAIVNAIPVLPLYLGGHDSKQGGQPILRAMLLNVNTNSGNPELVKQAIQEADPDVLVLEEISSKWLQKLVWLQASHPYSITQPREDNFGIGLFSKHPLEDGKVIHLGVNIPSIVATARMAGTPLRIVATHPTPPTSRDYSRWRNKQLDQLPDVLKSPLPLVLLGDLNVTPWNSHFTRLLQRSGLRDSSRGRGFHPTWPNEYWFLRIPIDHVLHSPDITVVDRRVGGDVESDHYPVIVDLVVPMTKTDQDPANRDLHRSGPLLK